MTTDINIPTGDLIIAKVGSNSITSSLVDGTQCVDPQRVSELAIGVARAREQNYRVIIVTSGAVAGGMHQEHLVKRPGVGEKIRLSSLAAIGQTQLMALYSDAFRQLGITIAQGLPTQDDFHRAIVSDHMRDTLEDLLSLGVVPILNENDFTSFAEMRFGDNDIIAALVGILCRAKHLVLFTVEEGIMTANPNMNENVTLLENIDVLTPDMFDDTQEKSAAGSGGINSKLYAGDLCRHSAINTAITHVDYAKDLVDIVEMRKKCSRFRALTDDYLPIGISCEIVSQQNALRAHPFFTVENYLA